MIKQKLEVGQKLYSEIKGGQIKTHIVSKVGKKYFEVENDRSRYHLENFLADSEWTRTQLYIDNKELENKIELKILMDSIRLRFSGYGTKDLSLDQARKIKAILEEK